MSLYNPIEALFTDFYELTMAAGYFARRMNSPATFSLYVRKTPLRNYFVAAGLESVLSALEDYRFTKDDIRFLKSTGRFDTAFLDFLATMRFSGQVRAMPEGVVFFPDEPVLEITAPLIEAQLVETFLLNTIGFESLIATKAARCCSAAGGRLLVDFALRRTHGYDAGMKVARSTYLAGFGATSNVSAGRHYGIPLAGTMAHSFVTAFETEADAFSVYAELFPRQSIFLVDTYDTFQGTRNAIDVAKKLKTRGIVPVGVRLDSGDPVQLSRMVRDMLDQAGLDEVKIFASGNLDEFSIQDILRRGARVDAFGVGTRVGVSADLPALDIVYKMVRYQGRYIRKTSPAKGNLAGEKQVFRFAGSPGRSRCDTICLADERLPGGEPMLETSMQNGRRLKTPPGLDAIRDRFEGELDGLDPEYTDIHSESDYPVHLSDGLKAVQR